MQEIWKDIKGYEGWYQVSNLGNVRSVDREVVYADGRRYQYKGRVLKPGNCKGYNSVGLSKNGELVYFRVCRLVAIHFIDNPNSLPQVNHKDENTQNDCVDNLEWCDVAYNNAYGTRVKRCHETAERNRRPFVCVETGKVYRNARKCARELGLLQTGINNVLKKRVHKHGGYHFRYVDEGAVQVC